MNWTNFRVAALFLGALLCSPLQILAAAQVAHLDDPAALMPESRTRVLEERLGRFERDAGIRILMRFHARSPSEAEDGVPGAFIRALSAVLGVQETGVLAVHFGHEDEWRVWVGNNLTARFVGKPGTAAEHTGSGAMHDAKEAWLEGVFAEADNAWKEGSTGTPDPSHRVSFSAEAIADGLMTKLSPGPASR